MDDPLAVQNEVNDAMNPNGGHQIQENNWRVVGSPNLDMEQYTADDEYMFLLCSS